MATGREESGFYTQAPSVLWCDDPLPPGLAARALLGQKGASLHALRQAKMPVPPFFIITTAAVEHPVPSSGLETDVQVEIRRGLEKLERETGKTFGDDANPLLLGVRCSADDAPAGLFPSVMNLGLSPRIATKLFTRTADDRFVYDCFRRLIMQFARMVHDVDPILFDRELRAEIDNRGFEHEMQLDGGAMQELTRRFEQMFSMRVGQAFPMDATTQFREATLAALRAGEHARALALRRRGGHDSPMPVAVIVQAMVFGNRLCDSYTGIAYSRDPNTGAAELAGEFYAGVQGIDVVSGRMTPLPLAQLKSQAPGVFAEISSVAQQLERQCADAQEFEFTVEQGKVYILQSRPAGRSGQAAVRIAVELAEAEVITRQEAVRRIAPDSLTAMLHARFDPRHKRNPLATGQPASPGAATGKVCFSAADAIARLARGERVILVRRETDASDVIAMQSCEGILTSTGGMTSHAAVVARGMGKPCIVGAGEIEVEEAREHLHAAGRTFTSDDTLSIDGVSGEVFAGELPRIAGQLTPELERLLSWADEIRTLRVYANADTPQDGKMAVRLGAEGVGLCRTEHMFFDPRRIVLMRKLILAGRDDVATRTEVLAALLPHQRADFVAIFKELAGRPVVVRLLDPPLHEFLPRATVDKKELAKSLGLTQREIGRRIEQLHEANPMLGHRGCRLAVTFPEIIQMQVRAILEAAMICREQGVEASPRIMVPLVIGSEEMALMAELVRTSAEQVMRDKGILIHYEIGTMIETPRAALLAGSIAEHAQFFSFGTNDLTQSTLAMSRDDSSRFLPDYEARHLLAADPFRRIDEQGVGELMQLAVARGRAARPGLACSVCGEHAGEAASIRFFSTLGLDYISCSPLRLPIARLAAAHAAM